MARSNSDFFVNRFVTVFSLVLTGMLLPLRMFAAFGLSDEGKVFVVDSGSGLVFKVDKGNGDIVSIRYKEGEELQEEKEGSHIASGLGKAKVAGAVMGGDIIKITIATDAKSGVARSLTHYLIVRKGLNNIYMATYPTAMPSVGELRWITRLDPNEFPDSPEPSNNRETVKPIESKDVLGKSDGTTRSKYYGDTKTHGKDRAMDMTFCGVSGRRVGVWMVYGTRESSSGGPFFRDIQNQSAEVYNYMNSGHAMTEPARVNVLHGPYALVFTSGRPPELPLDFSWIGTAGLGLTGYVPSSQRGSVVGLATGIPTELQGMIGFSNATAQYWAEVAKNGVYTSSLMKPGDYNVQLYRGEFAVNSGKVKVSAGAKTRLDLAAKPSPSALFKIGEWDGTPAGFLNGDKIVAMHPSDERMGAWAPVTFTVGFDPVGIFPALQMRKVNSPTTIRFKLTKDQIADRELHIGITCAYASSRPGIKVNAWSPSKHPQPSNQPNSRSFTIGTYRGNNALFSYTIPASAFVAGANTLTITPVSGEKDLGSWLSAGWCYDAIQLDAAPAMP